MRTLDERWDALAPKQRRELFDLAEARGDVIETLLRDLIRATPRDAIDALDELTQR